MPSSKDEFALPTTERLDTSREGDHYKCWDWVINFHFDWHGLQPFVQGTAVQPASDASEEEWVTFRRAKMMAYCILHRSIGGNVMELITEEGRLAKYDRTYDVKAL